MNQFSTLYHLIFIVKIKIIMKVCILGDGLISLALAKALINKGIYVDIYSSIKKKRYSKLRTLGISKSNINFINQNIENINKFIWPLKKIEIYTENLDKEKILNFENNNNVLFSIIKNIDLNKLLEKKLKKNRFCKFFKKKFIYDKIRKKYKLIINTDIANSISKKYFFKKFEKNYNSYAHTSIIKHKKILKNDTAYQIFTSRGPLAFLPISNSETSIIFSARGKKKLDFNTLIRKYNIGYKIKSINDFKSFELKSSNLRTYFYKNILAFGDLIHKIHPLAGQGFNMSLRDTKVLLELIQFKIDHGLELDNSICKDFEKKIKHKNYIFLNSIDFVYEFFNFESRINNGLLSKSVKVFGRNMIVNKFFQNLADKGF